jgi:hypothetical protein
MSEYSTTCELKDMDSGDVVAKATGETDASPVVARNSASMQVVNDDDVDWEDEGEFVMRCYTND